MKDHPTQAVYSQTFGTGPRSVLAVHCSLAHSGAWRGLAKALGSESVTMQGFDLLSHGKSPAWDGEGLLQLRNAEAGLELLAEQVDRNGGPVDLIGHSFGATVALAMAEREPELIRSLILIEPVLFELVQTDDPAAYDEMMVSYGPVKTLYESGDVAQATRLFNRAWGTGKPKWPDLPQSLRDAMVAAFPAVMACDNQVYSDAAGLLAPGRIEALPMPVAILGGMQSQPIMMPLLRVLERRLRSAPRGAQMPLTRSHMIEGAGHMLPITHADICAGHISDFWADAAY